VNPSGLDRALRALEPYLDDLVLCGAWAWYLYRRCIAQGTEIPADFTRDLDCIGRQRLPVRQAELAARLDEHGFVWVPRGDESPPLAFFAWPSGEKPEVLVEFLTPARGAGSRRTVWIQRGVAAQALWHLAILQDDPLGIEIDDRSPLAGELRFRGTVRVPKIGHFVVQKALIHGSRTRDQQVKDLYYVFDLIDSANGLAERVLEDVVAAEGSWSREVVRFVEVLEACAAEPAFVNRLLEQFPRESRPPLAYVEREVRGWLARLQAARRRHDT
jgi:hypothetical protein